MALPPPKHNDIGALYLVFGPMELSAGLGYTTRQTSPPITPTIGYARVSREDQSDLWLGGCRAGVAVNGGGMIAEMGEKRERVSLGT